MYKVSSSHFQFTGTENSDHNIQKTLSIIGSDNTCFHYVYFVNLIKIRLCTLLSVISYCHCKTISNRI